MREVLLDRKEVTRVRYLTDSEEWEHGDMSRPGLSRPIVNQMTMVIIESMACLRSHWHITGAGAEAVSWRMHRIHLEQWRRDRRTRGKRERTHMWNIANASDGRAVSTLGGAATNRDNRRGRLQEAHKSA